jgi:2-C-methyl-D-erythritol 4-phosphate cytidylyltransferase/2-C-methyl-D-erythritol 2,4-cyclodiphosphate synthase
MNQKYKVSAIIVAGGKGTRIGGSVPKQYVDIDGESALEKSIKAFYNNKLVGITCVVIAAEHEPLFKNIAAKYPDIIYCTGGSLRQDSVRAGLEKLKAHTPELVLIHDAARPFVSEKIINSVINELNNSDAVLPAVKVKDTIKLAENSSVKETLARENLYSAQTPQGFKFGLIYDLHQKYKDQQFTDDVALAEKDGVKVKIVEGDYSNYKITTEDDLISAKMTNQKQIRVGNGFDVHQFADGRDMVLCGVKIPYIKKLRGHSDADCAWHALTDALLGSIGLGDIGEHFPDSDAKWKGADSSIFLKFSVDEIKKRGGEISNVDITVICEEPKLKIHKEAMKNKTAEIIGISADRVNIKATTTEKLGFLGRKEGLAVFATATVLI